MDGNLKIGRIYKITSENTDKIYIGSTTKKISERLCRHQYDYKGYINNKRRYVTSYDILKCGNVKIELIEEFKYTEINELHKKERYFIELNRENCVNKNIPSRTQKEWIKIHYEEIKQKHNEKFTCECRGVYTKVSRLVHMKSKCHIKYIIIKAANNNASRS
jgi:hypothetical protein